MSHRVLIVHTSGTLRNVEAEDVQLHNPAVLLQMKGNKSMIIPWNQIASIETEAVAEVEPVPQQEGPTS